MPGHDHGGAVGYAQLVVGDALVVELLELCHHRHGVDDHAVAHHVHGLRVEDAARDAAEGVFMTVEHDSVPGIVSALIADHHIGAACEIIGDFSFAFVSPLGADHY